MKSERRWIREWFTREMPLEGTPLTASFELYDVGVVGIHLHNCFDDGIICTDAVWIVNRFRSRTEYDEIGSGIYILIKAEMPYFDGYQGLQIETYYLTRKTIYYEDIVPAQAELEQFLKDYRIFEVEPVEYVSDKYYRSVTMEGDILKISLPCVDKGSRHKTLLSYGGSLIAEGLPIDRIEVKMYDFNMLYCVPPLPFDEFQTILKSVKNYIREV